MGRAENCEALRRAVAVNLKGASGREIVFAAFQSSFLIFDASAPVDVAASACPEHSFERAG